MPDGVNAPDRHDAYLLADGEEKLTYGADEKIPHARRGADKSAAVHGRSGRADRRGPAEAGGAREFCGRRRARSSSTRRATRLRTARRRTK